MTKEEHQESRKENFPYTAKWDFRLGSPQRVFRALQDSLEDLNYRIHDIKGIDKETQNLQLVSSPISDTAMFGAKIHGEKQLSEYKKIHYIYGGIISLAISAISFIKFGLLEIIFGIICFLVGIVIFRYASRISRSLIVLGIQGEAYKATAEKIERSQEMDVVADVRLTAKGKIEVLTGDGKSEFNEIPRKADEEKLEKDFEEIRRKIEDIVPSYEAK